ncbi:MAG: MFS transporter [Alphaproteobacteria bacterium]|nr:MFS transporter [Alphaproteobacteria bacterium]MBV9373126.1 MFS transporter [Alphaproteobacteria bacterium]MBV9902844.1 MFS transporter [Alphaproteobacteria bacterium]
MMASTSPLSKERFALLFAVMLVAASGSTAMQSLMPAIGRELHIADLWVAVAFSLSAAVWVAVAPHWARRADRRGRRALMRLGLYGFIASMLVCGTILAAGLHALIPAGSVFAIFIFGRAIYGGWGSASPSAVQAYIAARTEGAERTRYLSGLASSFGLGTILGPAVAPLFIFEPLGLAGPLFVFAGIGALVLAALILRLPDDTPRSAARGEVADFPAMGGLAVRGDPGGDSAPAKLRWTDPRVLPWTIVGVVGGHGNAALLGVIGFLVIDRSGVPLAEAQQSIAIVLMAGAGATLLAQWGLIPFLSLTPRQLVLWGLLLSAAGIAVTGIAVTMYGITLGFALASLGFGLFRPGFTSGASLAVGAEEQNAVAGMVTSVNGVAYIAAPAAGVALYGLWMPLPFLAVAGLLAALALWVRTSGSTSP